MKASPRRRRAPAPRGARHAIASEALVLGVSEWSESSRVVHLLLPDHGRVALIARGVDRPSSPWRGVFDHLCHLAVELEAEEGRELHALRGARLLEHFPRVRSELARWYRALYAAELAEAAAQPGQAAPELFSALRGALERWNAPTCDAEAVLLAFEWRFLDALGLAPALVACASCGRRVDPARARTALFHPGAGGVQCSACRTLARVDLMPARPGTRRQPWRRVPVATLLELERSRSAPVAAAEVRSLAHGEPPAVAPNAASTIPSEQIPSEAAPSDAGLAARRAARLLLDDFLAWQLERPSRVRPFLR
jgi:DNA repair protein RecO (recombination protein O)